jgi:hypothetical protein
LTLFLQLLLKTKVVKGLKSLTHMMDLKAFNVPSLVYMGRGEEIGEGCPRQRN